MKKITLMTMLMFSLGIFAQSTINVTTSGGSFATEKWVSITSEPDGAGTQVWGQGNGTQCDGAGLINQNITIPAGTYYVNCYDAYDDGWDGTLIVVTAYGNIIGDNGGVSPDDGEDTDTVSACEGTPEELEASFQIVVPEAPSCPPVNDLLSTPVSVTETTLTWTLGGTETEWTYEYGVSPYTQGGGGTTGTVMTTPELSLTGLTGGETYDLFIQSNCGGEDSTFTQVTWSQPNLGDNCNAPIVIASLPYTTTDDTANYGDNYSGSPGTSCASSFDYLNGDDVVYSFTAEFTGSAKISLSGLSDTYSGVFAYANCSDIGVNCLGGSVAGGGTADHEFDLPVVTNETYYIVISTWAAPQSTAYTLDVFEITCPDPSALTATNVTPTSADLSWTENGTSTDWNIELLFSGETATGTATASGVSNPYNITTLVDATSYDYYVQANCTDSQSQWIGPFTFTTPCLATTTFPSSTDFTDNVPNSCWDEAGSGEFDSVPGDLGLSDWKAGRAYTDDMEVVVNSNVMNLYQGNTDREWLISPVYNIPSDAPYGLEVTVAVTDYSFSGTSTSTDTDTMGSDDEVKLLITTDNGATWTELTTWNVGNQPAVTGTKFLADLTAISGDVRFAIWASDGVTNDAEDYDFHVGGFTVDTLSALGTDEFISDTSVLSFHPNPVNNILTIKSKTNITSIQVLNLLGQRVKAVKNSSVSVNLDMSDLSQGAYFVRIASGELIQTIRIIKK